LPLESKGLKLILSHGYTLVSVRVWMVWFDWHAL